MTDLPKLRYTLEQMSSAAAELLANDPAKVDVSWLAGFQQGLECTIDAIT